MPTVIGIIQENYAKYYNSKYKHTGQVFENPFKSKPILNISHFFKIISYILNNPVVAKISSEFLDYPWSSSIYGYDKFNLTDFLYINRLNNIFNNCSLENFLLKNITSHLLCKIEISRKEDSEAYSVFIRLAESISDRTDCPFETLTIENQKKIIQLSYYNGLSIRQLILFSGKSQKFIRNNKDGLKYI